MNAPTDRIHTTPDLLRVEYQDVGRLSRGTLDANMAGWVPSQQRGAVGHPFDSPPTSLLQL